MAQPKSRNTVYNNDDLNRPLKLSPSKSPVWTNADLKYPKDDFEPDDFEPDVKDDFIPDEESIPEVKNTGVRGGRLPEADTYEKGFIRSVLNSVADAPEQIKAYGEGVIRNLPQNIMSGIEMLGKGALLAAGPVGEMISGRSTLDRLKGIGESTVEAGKGIYDITANSGNDPREFARLMGEMTGQPLLTAGAAKSVPPIIRGAGYPTELSGRIMKNYGVGMPRIFESRLQRGIERGIGGGIEKLGQKMKQVGKNPKVVVTDGKVTNPGTSPLVEGQPLTSEANISYRKPIVEGENLAPPTKPNVRLNRDGTFTNLDTGEIFDSTGKPLGEPIVNEPITRDSTFFEKNRPESIIPEDIMENPQVIESGTTGNPRQYRDFIDERNRLPEEQPWPNTGRWSSPDNPKLNLNTLEDEIQEILNQRRRR